jgi:hypothetical protein
MWKESLDTTPQVVSLFVGWAEISYFPTNVLVGAIRALSGGLRVPSVKIVALKPVSLTLGLESVKEIASQLANALMAGPATGPQRSGL